ncbi:MAG: antibiotic biosynthesis monooxygenase [Acidobacteriota bacterium]
MYIINAFFSIVPGNERKAYDALGQLALQVQRSEPDTWFYLIHTPNLDPGINIYPPPAPVQVAFVEGYKDRDAFVAHHTGPNLRNFITNYGSLFLNMYGPTSPFVIVQTLELAVGFIRPEEVDPNVFQVEARWVMKPGNRKNVAAALVDYVKAVKDNEPGTYMYTVSFADESPDSLAIPPMQLDQVTYNSAWKDHEAFVAHTKEPVYQDFLKAHGDLFVQAVPGSTMHPYMTTSVLKRLAGFLRPEAFVG